MTVIETHGRYRLRVKVDPDGQVSNPRNDDNLANVITPTQSWWKPIDEDGGPLQYGWNYFSTRPESEALFIRWARMVHGATVVEYHPHDGAWGLWYVMPDKAAETTVTPEEIVEAEYREYRMWAKGEVYGYIIERRVVWQRTETTANETMTTWEEVESRWGFIGYTWAEEAGREAFAPYTKEPA